MPPICVNTGAGKCSLLILEEILFFLDGNRPAAGFNTLPSKRREPVRNQWDTLFINWLLYNCPQTGARALSGRRERGGELGGGSRLDERRPCPSQPGSGKRHADGPTGSTRLRGEGAGAGEATARRGPAGRGLPGPRPSAPPRSLTAAAVFPFKQRVAARAGFCVGRGGSCPPFLPADSCCRSAAAGAWGRAAAALAASSSLAAAARVPSRRRGCSGRRGSAPHRSASDRRPLRGCVIAMARRLFPGAWLRKPHYVQVGRQRAVPRGGRVGPAPAPFPPGSRLPPRPSPAKLPQERAPPAGLAASPGTARARPSFPPAGAWRRTGLGCGALGLGGSAGGRLRRRGWR